MVRQHYQNQRRFDLSDVANFKLNLECRDEIVPLLAGLQFLYTNPKLRLKVVKLVASDLNMNSRRDVGRKGMDDWQVVVLAAVRLGCNFDYDRLEDLVQNHRSLRQIMGIGDWEDTNGFTFRRIRDTLCQLQPITIENINLAVVKAGQEIHGTAAESIRADSFVIETNIHYPTESSLIRDGVRKFVPICIEIANMLGVSGWRQVKHLYKKIKKLAQTIGRLAASKSRHKKDAMTSAYADLLSRCELLIRRAKLLVQTARDSTSSESVLDLAKALDQWLNLTEQVCNTAHRRVMLGEKVPNCEKLFSLFETHTQLYRRGKAGEPNQYGRMALVYEDGAGFISHYHLMDRDQRDPDVIVEQTKVAQSKHSGKISTASFDRGFHSSENETALHDVVATTCIYPRNPGQYAKKIKNESVSFHRIRLKHSGVEAAIGVLQRGNGLKRCRDRGELSFERYLGLAILGRNIQTFGKMLIAMRQSSSAAGFSKRKAA